MNGRIPVEEVGNRVNSTLEKYPVNGESSVKKFGDNSKSSEKRFGDNSKCSERKYTVNEEKFREKSETQ